MRPTTLKIRLAGRVGGIALGAALLAGLGGPMSAPAAAPAECAVVLNPPQDERLGNGATVLTMEEYLGPSYARAFEAVRPYWRGACQMTFAVGSDYLVSSRVGLFTNQGAARSVRRLRASAFPMDSTERRLAAEIDREALVARGNIGARPALEAVWRRGPALLDVTVMGPAGRPLPTRALTLVANREDRQALRYLSTSE
jgi:hypothetical protein